MVVDNASNLKLSARSFHLAVFITKVWGFHAPIGPLQFSSEGWRSNAREEIREGDLVVLVGTQSSPTIESERGRLLGITEPTIEPVMSLDFQLQTRPQDYDSENNYKWPFGLLNKRAWKLLDRPLLSEISSRHFGMSSVLGLVKLTDDEASKVVQLRKEAVELITPTLRAQARIFGRMVASRRTAPPPGLIRRPIMHLRSASAYTYAMEVRSSSHIAYKIGWAFDFNIRARQFNQSAMPELGGVQYKPVLFEQWPTARKAFAMEQKLLRHFEQVRHRSNHEIITSVSFVELSSAWVRLIQEGLRSE